MSKSLPTRLTKRKSAFSQSLDNYSSLFSRDIYRPPSANLHEFLESFQQLLHRVTRDNKMCYIMGDFNLDLLNTDLHSATNEFINALFSHFLYPLISRPTRLTSYSATLIDNIFTNNISASHDNGLIINDLSDHLPIFTLCYTDAHSSTIKPKESVAIRNFSSRNINAFNRGTQRQFSEKYLFGRRFEKFLACLPLVGLSNI